MYTVYFDTSFYVDLAKLDDAKLDEIIHKMNDLNLRVVYSFDISSELLANFHRPDSDQKIVSAISRLNISSLCLDRGNWDCLLLSGEERKQIATDIKNMRIPNDLGHSFSLAAERDSGRDFSQFIEANSDYYKSIGIDDPVNTHQLELFKEQAKALNEILMPIIDELEPSVRVLFKQTRDLQFDVLRTGDPEDAKKLEDAAQQLILALSNAYPEIESERKIRRDVFRDDNKPIQIAYGEDREKWLSKAGHSYRDAGHMNRFYQNSNDIDFLQVDKRQYNAIKKYPATKVPLLVSAGLDRRIFRATSPSDALDKIEELIATNITDS